VRASVGAFLLLSGKTLSLPRLGRLPTGNDYLSVPQLQAADFSVPDLNFISGRLRGLVELLGGSKGEPFLAPLLVLNGKAVDLGATGVEAGREDYWTPTFRAQRSGVWELHVRLVCPPQERGAFLDLRLRNLGAKPLKARLGAQGAFGGVRLCINEPYALGFWRRAELSGVLNAKHIVLSVGATAPEYALAVGSDQDLDELAVEARSTKRGAPVQVEAASTETLRWRAVKAATLAPGQELRLGIILGLGLEAVSAAATCVEFRRRGLDALAQATGRWLQQRRRLTGDERLDELLHWNLFFNLFYATGVCLDDERFVCLTSRSPRYYVSGAYWDRDALLWSLPAIQLVDPPRARRVLEYAFTVQGRNIGVHSRFLDGTVLEPGFELDELCAPVVALAAFVRQHGEQGLLKLSAVRETLRHFERVLASRKHPNLPLYNTLSGPDDDHEPLGYLTVDNAWVWKALLSLAELKERLGRGQEAAPLREQAERVRQAVRQNLTADGPRGRMFVWSADLRGRHRFYDSPAGSLQLLPWMGFCKADDHLWRNTVAWLHSEHYPYSFVGQPFAELGCAHSPQPWTLSLCNSLLSGRKEEARRLLLRLELDGGLACEAFDAKTGKPYSGEAFATCAGFLAYAIHTAFGAKGAQAQEGLAARPQPLPRAGALGGSIHFPKPPAASQPKPQGEAERGAGAPLRSPPLSVQAAGEGGAGRSADPTRPVGAVILKGGKRSTKGVEAIVKPEPLRPPKTAQTASGFKPVKAVRKTPIKTTRKPKPRAR
jgi:hypothetical protein